MRRNKSARRWNMKMRPPRISGSRRSSTILARSAARRALTLAAERELLGGLAAALSCSRGQGFEPAVEGVSLPQLCGLASSPLRDGRPAISEAPA
eukprot:scaffold3749_cov119-Isochrysis_galbana.AAC.3